ncbi:hypothetical protein NX059_007976 [Plenodomus lindquistii]|nr:hypothetical protein NX059_007976 [Plenodomus lindquistii]
MTPRTRAGNRDADFKAYYSKTVPQQVHFPHKRKTVRRPSSPVRGDAGKRQLVFLPDKMKVGRAETIGDSDEETEDEDVEIENEKEPVPTASKRRRTIPAVKTGRALRRQSTMTQLVDGRRPLSDSDEPDFRPVKRSSRPSWSGKGRSTTKDKDQRTLTQMIPGMRPFEIQSDEDIEDASSHLGASDEDNQAYDLAVAQRLAVQCENQPVAAEVNVEPYPPHAEQITAASEHDKNELPLVVVQSVQHATSDTEEKSYRPTQFITAPSSRPRRIAQQITNAAPIGKPPSVASTPVGPRARKARFSLLSTPEKRRIREIASSQSPPDSPLSTQMSPQKLQRSPLHASSGNSGRAPETPSKRKRVAFEEPSALPTLKKFESTIQDSEDEDDEIENDNSAQEAPRSLTVPSPELGDIYTRTHKARAHLEEQAPDTPKSSRDHNGEPATCQISVPHSQSRNEEGTASVLMSVEVPFPDSTECLRSTPLSNDIYLQETFPSTPMVIQDDSSDEEAVKDYTPPHQIGQHFFHPGSAEVQHTADLDGEPIQVPRSPSSQHETQQSHSSKAEQQLQSEWFSYSQYVNTQPPTSSSMFAVHDLSSYGIGHSSQRKTAPQAHSVAHSPSQATTLDEVTQRTPQKNRTQQMTSPNTTPRRVASSQPMISPNKPPPLFIPSSFPSPAKTEMHEWSSPMCGKTQDVLRSSQYGASWQDFSIPPPPPPDDEWEHEA